MELVLINILIKINIFFFNLKKKAYIHKLIILIFSFYAYLSICSYIIFCLFNKIEYILIFSIFFFKKKTINFFFD